MLSLPLPSARRPREEGEKPFWISYSDLMTALMVLFLVVMSVSLLTITQELLAQQRELEEKNRILIEQQKELFLAKQLMDALKAKRDARQQATDQIMTRLENAASAEPFAGTIRISRDQLTIDFGEAVRFGRGDYRLTQDGKGMLRAFVPFLLKAVESPDGREWFKRVVVEGFTDIDGSYLYNLDLSLKRAQSVVCALLETPAAPAIGLAPEEQRRVRDLFLVGGFSFNLAKASKEESRRVELRLEFRSVEGEEQQTSEIPVSFPVEVGKCQLN